MITEMNNSRNTFRKKSRNYLRYFFGNDIGNDKRADNESKYGWRIEDGNGIFGCHAWRLNEGGRGLNLERQNDVRRGKMSTDVTPNSLRKGVDTPNPKDIFTYFYLELNWIEYIFAAMQQDNPYKK